MTHLTKSGQSCTILWIANCWKKIAPKLPYILIVTCTSVVVGHTRSCGIPCLISVPQTGVFYIKIINVLDMIVHKAKQSIRLPSIRSNEEGQKTVLVSGLQNV